MESLKPADFNHHHQPIYATKKTELHTNSKKTIVGNYDGYFSGKYFHNLIIINYLRTTRGFIF